MKNGQASNVFRVKLRDSSLTTGAGLTGLSSSSTGLIISTIADNESAATAYTVAGSTVEGITTLGTFAAPTATKVRFKEVDATNHKGLYEVQIADARFAVSSAKSLTVSFVGAVNLAQCDVVIPLRAVDPYDSVRGGMTALPNAAAGANAGLPVLSSSATTLAYTVSTLTTYTGNTAQTGDSFARLGVAGAGLTALGDTRLANLDATVSSRLAAAGYTAPPSAATNASAVWEEAKVPHNTSGTFGFLLDAQLSLKLSTSGYTAPPTAAQVATAVWTDVTAGDFTTAGTPGKVLLAQLGGAFTTSTSSVYSTAALANGPTGGTAPTAAAIADEVRVELATELGRIDAATSTRSTYAGGAVASVTAPVTVAGTVNATLVSTGLDAIALPTLTGPPATFPGYVVMLYRRFFKKAVKTSTQLKTYKDDGTTVVTTQTVSDTGGTQTQGAAS